MAQIAAHSGVSKGTLYNYFDSKEALFIAHVEDSCALRVATVFDGVTVTGDIVSTLHLLAERTLNLLLSRQGVEMYRLVVSIAPKFPDLAATFFAAGAERALGHMREFLERANAAGQLQMADPRFAAEQFFALCQTKLCLRRRLNLPEEAPEATQQVIDGAVEMFLRMYGPN